MPPREWALRIEDILESIEKIRRKLTNQRHYKTRNSKPWEDGAEDGAIE